MPVEYAVRNATSIPIGLRIPTALNAGWNTAAQRLGIPKSVILQRLIAAYLDGRLGTHQTDLPMPPIITKDDIMAVAKKSKVAVKAKAAPAAKVKTAAAKKK
jgi:hypothetical protein